MLDLLFTPMMVAFGAVAVGAVQRRFRPAERPLIWAGYLAHVAGAVAIVLVVRYFYGAGDLLAYFNTGRRISDWVMRDFAAHSIDLLKILFHDTETYLPVQIYGRGGSTASMFAFAGFVALGFGSALYATCMAMSLLAFTGQLALYAGIREIFLPRYRKRLLVATLLIPTVVFWSSGLMKDTLAVTGLGYLFFATQRLVHGEFRIKYLLVGGIGMLLIGLFKSYILFPFFIAAGAWYYWRRSLQTSGEVAILAKPWYFVVGVAVAIGAMFVFDALFPTYGPGNITKQLYRGQYYQQQLSGGSTYSMPVPQEKSFAAQLYLAPIGLTAALFRPFLFEAHNSLALVNALETTCILGLFVYVLIRRGIRETFEIIVGSPGAIFCLVFVLLFATAVGLAAPNLGTLSRYRIPMMPFYVSLLFLLVPIRRR